MPENGIGACRLYSGGKDGGRKSALTQATYSQEASFEFGVKMSIANERDSHLMI